MLKDRATQVVLAAFLCFGVYAVLRPELHHVVGLSDHYRFVANKLLTAPRSLSLVIAGNSRSLFGIQCGRFDDDRLPRNSMNLGVPSARYTERYLDFIDRSLAPEGPRIVVLCLGESSFRAKGQAIRFEYFEENGAKLRATTSDALDRRLAPLPITSLAETWQSRDRARINADRRRRFEHGSFRSDGCAVVDLPAGDPGEPHAMPPADLSSEVRAHGRHEVDSVAAAFADASLDPGMAKALLDAVRRWREGGVVVAVLRMPDYDDSEEFPEPTRAKAEPLPRAAAFAELGRALRQAGAVELKPSFEGLRTWDGVHMDGASAAIFTERVEDELRRVVEQCAD
jgi:hypothetical protein